MLVRALPFALSFTFLPVAVLAMVYGGFWTYAGAIYGLMLIPFVDYFGGLRIENADPYSGEGEFLAYRVLTWLWVPAQLGIIFGMIAVAGTGRLSQGEIIAAMASIGLMTGGAGITYAHEMMHQTNRFERALSEVLMTSVLYGHFCVEHVHGHHIHVATPRDPVTARSGESLYAFLPRAVSGSFFSAWRIVQERLARRGHGIWHRSNPFWRYLLAYAIFTGTAYALAGWFGMALFVLQAVVAFILLEIINYVEHYGLMRRIQSDGRYERVEPHHSWNASHRITNYFLINLQRHSDHHTNPRRRFPILQHYGEEEAPQLPFGYPAMLIVALIPPLWFRLMDPKVEAWRCRFSESLGEGRATPRTGR